MRLVQFKDRDGARRVAMVGEGGELEVLGDCTSVHELASIAVETDAPLTHLVTTRLSDGRESLDQVLAEGRILAPLDHPDPAHCIVTGTGLTHLGSADARDQMHVKLDAAAADDALTDSMKMFKLGLDGGKPAPGETGVQPEWFYKGDGACVVPPEAGLAMPAFALDGGDEAEIAGLYIIAPDGTPCRIGYALGNEYADHVMERQNYLYLAHSKLRPCSFGPELLIGELPADVAGTVRVRRGNEVVWEKPFRSGEANMSHSLANLEHHHFKYGLFRRPGDVHVHFFGADAISTADGVETRPGDVFEIESELFGRPLRNGIVADAAEDVRVRTL